MQDPTPTRLNLSSASAFRRFRQDPIAFLRDAAKEHHGKSVEFRFGGRRIVLLQDPVLIEQVLVEQAPLFEKGPGLRRAKGVLGDGLLTRPTEGHPEQKRRLQPAFRRAQADSHVPAIGEVAAEWADGIKTDETLNLHAEMMGITLRAVSSTLFDSTTVPNTAAVANSVVTALHGLYSPFMAGDTENRCPHESEIATAVDVLESELGAVLKGRRGGADERADLFSLLVSDQDGALSPQEIRDDAVSVFLAGHESTANCLSWTWYALSQHPEIEEAFHREIDSLEIAEGDTPTAAQLATLDFTRRLLLESMRLYPPAWMLSREAREPVHMDGLDLEPGDIAMAAQCVSHVDNRYFERPFEFDPDRWLPEVSGARPRFSYFPFGAGPRVCIGENFAFSELLTILTVVGRRWSFQAVPETDPTPEPLITLRPKNGMTLRAVSRP